MSHGIAPQLEAKVGRWIAASSRWLALIGGGVLTALAVMTVVSIIGRGFVFAGLAPIPGDFELVEVGCAIAVFFFLPWCQYGNGHVTVDILVDHFPRGLRAFLTMQGNIALAFAAGLIAWRLVYGLIDRYSYDETTMILGLPIWYGYAAGLLGAVWFTLTCLFTTWRSLNTLISSREEAT